MGRQKSIFENVTFLNEGLGTILIIGLVGMYATALVVGAGYSLAEKSQRNAVKKALKTVSKREDIQPVDQRITSITKLSKKDLMDKNKIEEKDISTFVRADVSIFAALEGDEILACIVYDHDSGKYKYFIKDKSIKGDALAYVYAKIELHMEFIGENIKKFVDTKKISLISSSNGKYNGASGTDELDIEILSKDVQDQIYKDLDAVCKESITFLKSKSKNYKIETEYNKSYKKGESDNEEYLLITITDPRCEDDYDEWSEKYMEGFYTESKQMVYQLMDKLKLSGSKQNPSAYKGTETVHPFIKIGDYQNNDEDAQYIYIGTIFDDIRSGRS